MGGSRRQRNQGPKRQVRGREEIREARAGRALGAWPPKSTSPLSSPPPFSPLPLVPPVPPGDCSVPLVARSPRPPPPLRRRVARSSGWIARPVARSSGSGPGIPSRRVQDAGPRSTRSPHGSRCLVPTSLRPPARRPERPAGGPNALRARRASSAPAACRVEARHAGRALKHGQLAAAPRVASRRSTCKITIDSASPGDWRPEVLQAGMEARAREARAARCARHAWGSLRASCGSGRGLVAASPADAQEERGTTSKAVAGRRRGRGRKAPGRPPDDPAPRGPPSRAAGDAGRARGTGRGTADGSRGGRRRGAGGGRRASPEVRWTRRGGPEGRCGREARSGEGQTRTVSDRARSCSLGHLREQHPGKEKRVRERGESFSAG